MKMNPQNTDKCLICNITILTQIGTKVRMLFTILTDFMPKVRQLGWLGYFSFLGSKRKKIIISGLECKKHPNHPNHPNPVPILVRILSDPSNHPNHPNYEVIPQ